MKLKENKGISLIVFTIILAVLVVVAGGVIIYLLKNPVKENVDIQNQIGTQTNTDNNQNKENIDKNNEEDSKYLELLKISLDSYISNLSALDKFDNISKANLEQIVYYSLHDADYVYEDEDGWEFYHGGIDKENIISDVAKRFDVSDSTIKNKINNMNIDPEKVAYYNYREFSGDSSYIERTYSKIQDIKYIGDNKYEVKAIQFDVIIESDGYGKVQKITIDSEDISKEIYNEIRKNSNYQTNISSVGVNEELDYYLNDITDILNYVKTNNIGNKIFTIEINDNYSIKFLDAYDNNECFRLLSIK